MATEGEESKDRWLPLEANPDVSLIDNSISYKIALGLLRVTVCFILICRS